ncbi:hypothetical protein HC231_23490 [Brenneria izadpanahii]|uniref:Inner membrane protein n=1 Tax=Brenneria izadpanahii TaxID=2722756 RepID=A0ABX7UY43_9GAMM|nr:hypothetical protein [Brenneria izadpanahii]QTF10554.1 hypothetical protein HC231_23490 [Brenneria izadpanahii]
MKIIAFLCGTAFSELIEHGRKTDAAIDEGKKALLSHSTLKMERYIAEVPAQLPRQNIFALSLLTMLLVVSCAINFSFLVSQLVDMGPFEDFISFAIPMMVFGISILTASYLVARGKNRGLLIYKGLYLFVTFIWLFHILYLSGEAIFDGQLPLSTFVFAFIVLGSLIISRWLMNSQAFLIFALYCRTKRLAHASKQVRMRKISKT